MSDQMFACPMARFAATALCAVPLPAVAQSSVPTDPTTIVVTGSRDPALDQTPATSATVTRDRLLETTAMFNAEDSLRYLPSLLVRKRHVGDTQAPLATRTSGVGASARSLVYVDGMLLSALIGNNNSTASPRWGIVSPEEIERVDVLYGPFAAAYAGNSIGAVVNITTRSPDEPEASLTAASSVQRFDQYATRGVYPAFQLAASAGDRIGPFQLFASANRLIAKSQPLNYVTVARPAATSNAGAPVAGAFADVNRTGVPIFVIGAGGLEDHRQDNFKIKLKVETPTMSVTYRGGIFINDTKAEAETYLSENRFAGLVNIDGRAVTIPASAFSNNVYDLDERHIVHGLVAAGSIAGWRWQAAGTRYRFAKFAQRLPGGALPAARAGGPGSVLRLDGTGWDTIDLSASRNGLSVGGHVDRVRLRQDRFATSDWRAAEQGALTQSAHGRTRTTALWAQQVVKPGAKLNLTLGARYEWWRADDGFNFSAAPVLAVVQPRQARRGLSPKATLTWRPATAWSVALSGGQAYRFPTVQELYQAVSTGPTLSVPNPDLKAERARSAELAVEHRDGNGHVRLSLFHETIRDALIAQSAPLVAGSASLFNFVQNIPRVRTHGVELAFERRGVLMPQLDLTGSLTLVRPTIIRDPVFPVAEGKDIPQVPRRRGTLVVTWRPDPAVALSLAGRFARRSFGTIDNSDVVSHTFQGFDGYKVVDARASFRINERMQLAVGVENIGNARYYLFHPFPQRSFTAEVHLAL